MLMKPDVECLHKKEYEIRDCGLKTAQDMTREYHYSMGGSNTAVYAHGLFKKGMACALEWRGGYLQHDPAPKLPFLMSTSDLC
jgi:hypothetical protein